MSLSDIYTNVATVATAAGFTAHSEFVDIRKLPRHQDKVYQIRPLGVSDADILFSDSIKIDLEFRYVVEVVYKLNNDYETKFKTIMDDAATILKALVKESNQHTSAKGTWPVGFGIEPLTDDVVVLSLTFRTIFQDTW